MKRVISLLLVVLLAFSLTACSQNGGTLPSGGDETTEATSDTVASTEVTSAAEAALSYDEMMSAAQDIDFNKVMTDLSENAARAKETYEGNCYRMAIPVSDIQPDYFYYLDYMGAVMVHLCNTQDLISLNKDCTYDVIGKITEVDGSIVIENAYIVECDELVFEMDGAYFCVAGSIDPAKYNLTPMNTSKGIRS